MRPAKVVAECPGQIWGDCPTRIELAAERDRYKAALELIGRYYICGWPDDPDDQTAIRNIAKDALA